MRIPELYSKKKCPICNKVYIVPKYIDEWAWKISYNRSVCSYSCMRKWEKQNIKKI